MKPLTLRTKLTLFYSITVSVLLTGFGLVYYRVLSVGLDRDITQDVIDRASGLRGYLRFEEGVAIFDYDPNDPDELRATGIQYSPQDLSHYAQSQPSVIDLQTDQGKIRLRNETVPGEGETY